MTNIDGALSLYPNRFMATCKCPLKNDRFRPIHHFLYSELHIHMLFVKLRCFVRQKPGWSNTYPMSILYKSRLLFDVWGEHLYWVWSKTGGGVLRRFWRTSTPKKVLMAQIRSSFQQNVRAAYFARTFRFSFSIIYRKLINFRNFGNETKQQVLGYTQGE